MPNTKQNSQQECLSTANLSIGYRNVESQHTVLENLNLSLYSGQLVALLGANGSGKSTLIRTLCSLQSALSGEVILPSNMGKNTASMAKEIAVVLTSHVYAPHFRVYDMVSSGRYPSTNWLGKLSKQDHEIVEHAIHLVGIEHLAKRLVHQLSDGERQKMMIAKALAQSSSIIILDEPTSHLDIVNRVEITKLLQKLATVDNKAILMATHDLDLAIQSANRLWLMDGNGVEVGAPEDLILNSKLQKVFGALSSDFDHFTGSFKINIALNKTIYLAQNNASLEEIWVEKALKKIGYRISENTDEALKLNWNKEDSTWHLKDNNAFFQFENIGDLIDYLAN